MLKVITVTSHPHLAQPLINSLEKHGWDWTCLQVEWKGFGTKLIETYQYLKANPEVSEFVFVDAHDVVCLGTPQEFEEKLDGYSGMIFSAERGCWPDPNLESQYPIKLKHGFNYLNSGVYYSRSDWFINYIERNFPEYHFDDQLYFTHMYLNSPDVLLDWSQEFFNSHSFIDEGEYTYDNGRVGINGNFPIFIHSNGKTVDPKLDEMLKNL